VRGNVCGRGRRAPVRHPARKLQRTAVTCGQCAGDGRRVAVKELRNRSTAHPERPLRSRTCNTVALNGRIRADNRLVALEFLHRGKRERTEIAGRIACGEMSSGNKRMLKRDDVTPESPRTSEREAAKACAGRRSASVRKNGSVIENVRLKTDIST